MKIYIVRHGQTESNSNLIIQGQSQDSKLTDIGISQANKVGNRLKAYNITHIYSSDLGRAIATAKIIGDNIDFHNIINSQLIRERSFGILEGLNSKTIEERYPTNLYSWRQNTASAPPEGESLDQVIDRCNQFIDIIKKSHDADDNILVVTHGGTVRGIVLALLGLGKEQWNKFNFKNASITAFEHRDKTVILYVNDTYHLDITECINGDDTDNK